MKRRAGASADDDCACKAVPQSLPSWRGPDQHSAQQVRDGGGKLIDDAQEIANDDFTPANVRAVQFDHTDTKYYFPDRRSLYCFHDYEVHKRDDDLECPARTQVCEPVPCVSTCAQDSA